MQTGILIPKAARPSKVEIAKRQLSRGYSNEELAKMPEAEVLRCFDRMVEAETQAYLASRDGLTPGWDD